MNIGLSTNNKELGLDNERVVPLVKDILDLFERHEATNVEVAATIALVLEIVMEDGCLLAVTPKVRAKLADAVFIGEE